MCACFGWIKYLFLSGKYFGVGLLSHMIRICFTAKLFSCIVALFSIPASNGRQYHLLHKLTGEQEAMSSFYCNCFPSILASVQWCLLMVSICVFLMAEGTNLPSWCLFSVFFGKVFKSFALLPFVPSKKILTLFIFAFCLSSLWKYKFGKARNFWSVLFITLTDTT